MQSKVQRGGGGAITGAVTREDVRDMVISSEESSSYPDELELGLGLGVGGGKVRIKPPASAAAGGGGRDRATAKNYPAKPVSSSSSSSSSVTVANTNNGSCGSKRSAEPPSPPPRSAISQVVGWPPVRTYRMNSLTNQSKSPEEFFSTVDKSQTKITVTNHGGNKNNSKEKGLQKTSLFVKVNMDRVPIGRKVDLNAHCCYEDLARALDHMFRTNRLNVAEQSLQLLGGSSEFVLTYEDKEGDWMLVGDVPWEMFLNTVRRLRIMRTAEANGLAHSLFE